MNIRVYTIKPRTLVRVPRSELGLSVLYEDLWLRRGVCVFTTFIAKDGTPFHLRDHVDRIIAGCKEVGIVYGETFPNLLAQELRRVVSRILGSLIVEVTVTPGPSSDAWHTDGKPRLFVALRSREEKGSLDKNGLSLRTVNYARPDAMVKDRNYRKAWSAYHQEIGKGGTCDDILYCDRGVVLELSRGNIFFVKNKTLYTPPVSDVLGGIMRSLVIRHARELGYKVVDTKRIHLRAMSSYRESFASSSIAGIVPITRVNGLRIGTGMVGMVTKHIKKILDAYQNTYFTSNGH